MSSRIVHQCLQQDDMTMAITGSYDTLIQDPKCDALRKCILTGPYTPTMVTTPAVPATEDSPEVPAKTSVEDIAASPKRVRDSVQRKKMLLCKQAEKGVQLQAEQSDWLADTDEEINEQELEAHYSYMAKIQRGS
ncbi:hypothetical protein Tco_1191592 [Tanacetum coccineum]